jgi:hypothetical protein
MPKDATKNVDRYKVRGGQLNEYEVEQNKAADKKQTDTDKRSAQKAAGTKKAADKTKAAGKKKAVGKKPAPRKATKK